MSELQPLVEQIRQLVESRMVVCLHDKLIDWDIPGAAARCPDCAGSNRRPDPTFAGLLDVVQEKCLYEFHGYAHILGDACPECGGSNHTTRQWGGMPQGALAGALIHSVAPVLSPDQHSWVMTRFSLQDNTDAAVAQAIIEWLRHR